jgi:hypothetical protein
MLSRDEPVSSLDSDCASSGSTVKPGDDAHGEPSWPTIAAYCEATEVMWVRVGERKEGSIRFFREEAMGRMDRER